jgi:hypothetical protein
MRSSFATGQRGFLWFEHATEPYSLTASSNVLGAGKNGHGDSERRIRADFASTVIEPPCVGDHIDTVTLNIGNACGPKRR